MQHPNSFVSHNSFFFFFLLNVRKRHVRNNIGRGKHVSYSRLTKGRGKKIQKNNSLQNNRLQSTGTARRTLKTSFWPVSILITGIFILLWDHVDVSLNGNTDKVKYEFEYRIPLRDDCIIMHASCCCIWRLKWLCSAVCPVIRTPQSSRLRM